MKAGDLGLLLFLGSIWGVAFMFISLGLRSFSPLLLAALRFDIVALVLITVAAFGRKGALVPSGAKQWAAVFLAGGLNIAAYHGFLFWGQQFTSPGIAAVIVGLNPLLTTVFSRAFLAEERVGVGGLLGLALGFAGVVLLATLKPGSVFDVQGLGEAMIVAAIVAWALGSVLVKRTGHGMEIFAFIAWHNLVGAAMLHVASLALEPEARWGTDLPGLASLFYLAIISSSIGFVIYFRLMERVGPIRSNLVSHVAPIFATIAGALFLGYPFELRSTIAFALIASGFFLVIRK